MSARAQQRWLAVRTLLESDTAALLIANLCAALLGVLTGVITARVLGPAGRGDLAVAIFWPSLATSFCESGITESTTIRIAASRGAWRPHARAGLALAVAASVIVTGIVYATTPLLLNAQQQHLVLLTRTALLFIPASLLSCVVVGTLLGNGRFRTVAAIRLANAVLYAAALLVATIHTNVSVDTIAWLTILSRVFPAAVGAGVIVSSLHSSTSELNRHLRHAASLQAARLATIAADSEDRILANWTQSQAAIGLWQVPAAVGAIMQFIPLAISQKLISTSAAGGRSPTLILTAYARVVIIAGVCALAAIPALPLLIPLVYGQAFRSSVAPAIIAVIASVAAAASLTLQAGARAQGDVRACIGAEAAGMLVMLIVGLPVSVWHGLIGLSTGVLTGRATSLVWMVYATMVRDSARLADFIPMTRTFARNFRSRWGSASDAAGFADSSQRDDTRSPAKAVR